MNDQKDSISTLRRQPIFPLRRDGTLRSSIARWLMENVGRVDAECFTAPFRKDADGRLKLRYAGGETTAARIMCWLKNGPPPTPEHEAAHSCGKGHEACVNPNHLSWKTHAQNMADMALHGTRVRGEAHPGAKLNNATVSAIRARVADGEEQKAIAAGLGVSRSVVCEAVCGKAWGHVA